MNHTRILVPISFSGGPEPAFEPALTLARTLDAGLYLIHAVPAEQPFSARGAERFQRWAELRERAAAAGVMVETVEQHGDPAAVITLHADAREADLIVMSTERRSGWDGIRNPSIAERVIRRTTRPTLVVPQDSSAPATFSNVLVAVDGSPASAAVIDAAKELFGGDARQLTVLHAVNSLEADGAVRTVARWVVPEYRRHLLNEARRQIEAVTASISADASMRVRVAPGPTAKTIVSEAAGMDADLIVVGRHKRLLPIRSTAIRLLRESDRALLIVPATASGRVPVNPEDSALRRAA